MTGRVYTISEQPLFVRLEVATLVLELASLGDHHTTGRIRFRSDWSNLDHPKRTLPFQNVVVLEGALGASELP